MQQYNLQLSSKILNNEEQRFIEINNTIHSFIKKSEKKTPQEKVSKIETLLNEGDFKQAAIEIFKSKINLDNISGIDTGYIKEVAVKSDLPVESFDKFHEFVVWMENYGVGSLIDYIQHQRKNPAKQKANLFSKIIEHYAQEINEKHDTTCVFTREEAIELRDFVFSPKVDSETIALLQHYGLQTKHEKGRDIVIKKGNHFFIGEAKDLNTTGGAQNKQLGDMQNCVEEFDTNGEYILHGLGILYGAVLSYQNKYLIKCDKTNIISIMDFIDDLNPVCERKIHQDQTKEFLKNIEERNGQIYST